MGTKRATATTRGLAARRAASLAVALGAAASLAGACGGSSSPSPATPADGGGDAAATDASSANELTMTFGPVDVAPGEERTQCLVKRLGNVGSVHVGSIHNALGAASHHMVVYRVSDTVEQPTPKDCTPFVDTLDPTRGSPLVVTQKKDDVLALPPGVAYTFDPNQMLRLEVHYVNPGAKTVSLTASTTMRTITDAEFKDEAGFLFIGDPDIQLPANGDFTLGPIFFPVSADYAGAKFFAITGHEHQFGTNVTVSTAKDADDPGTPVYDVPGWLWSEPKTVTPDPPFSLPAGGGFKFSCSWRNTSDKARTFGESAEDEMCFFWAYYYPANGSRVCFHTTQYGAGDVCCPGSAVCPYLQKFL